MSLRTLLILRGVIVLITAAIAVISFADGRTVFGVLWSAFTIANVVIIVAVARRRS